MSTDSTDYRVLRELCGPRNYFYLYNFKTIATTIFVLVVAVVAVLTVLSVGVVAVVGDSVVNVVKVLVLSITPHKL